MVGRVYGNIVYYTGIVTRPLTLISVKFATHRAFGSAGSWRVTVPTRENHNS